MRMGRGVRWAVALLLLAALVVAEDHDHAEEHDDHDDHGEEHDDHDDHGSGEYAFEWAGTFAMKAGSNTLTLSKVGGKYAADHMVVALMALEEGAPLADQLEMGGETMMHGAEHAGDEMHMAECKEEVDELGTDHCPITVSQGGVVEAGLREAGAEPRVFILEMDEDAPMTIFKINVAEAGSYAMFAEHAMAEFDGEVHYLKGPDGESLEPLESFPAEEVCEDGRLRTDQIWGYSMAGSLIGAAMSLWGALLIVLFGGGQGLASVFSHSIIVNSFAAGILIGLVFVHLLPEAISMAGGFDWKVSTCVIGGLFLGLITEHLLHLLGFEHTHAGHSHALTEAETKEGKQNKRELEASQYAQPPPKIPALPSYAPSPQYHGYNNHAGYPMPYAASGWGGANSISMTTSNTSYPAPPLPHGSGGQMVVSGGNFGSHSDASTEDVAKGEEGGHHHHHHGHAHSATDTAIIINILVGDFFHNLFDGVAIGSAFMSCGALGWMVTASVVVHELPQEMSDFFILVKAGLTVPQALLANLCSSASSIIGVIIVLLIDNAATDKDQVTVSIGRLLAFSSGILLYVGVGLLSEIPKTNSRETSLVAWLVLFFAVSINGLLLLWDVHCEGCGAIGHQHDR